MWSCQNKTALTLMWQKVLKVMKRGFSKDHSTQGGTHQPSEVKQVSEQINAML